MAEDVPSQSVADELLMNVNAQKLVARLVGRRFAEC
jgi:hypothetical protein